MKGIFFSIIFLSSSVFADCVKPAYRCECEANVPFEGYVIFVVEKCGSDEEWIPLGFRERQYDNMTSCRVAIPANKVCQSLNN